MGRSRTTGREPQENGRFGTYLLQAAIALGVKSAVRTIAPSPQKSEGRGSRSGTGDDQVADGAEQRGSGLWFTVKRVWAEIGNDRVLSVAGGLTFFGLLAIFPAITALVSIFGLFAEPQQVTNYLGSFTSVLPPEAATILLDQAKTISAASSANLSLAVLIALALALWSANGGTKALIEALNVAYGVVESRSFLKLNAFSLVVTILGIILALLLIAGIAVLPALLAFLGLGSFAEGFLLFARWPAIFAIMIGVLALAYRFGPDVKDAVWQWITPGALFAAIGLVIFSLAFSWYVQNLGSYNETYGSLGAVVALMTWMWLSATLVLIGAEVNSELDRQANGEKPEHPAIAPSR